MDINEGAEPWANTISKLNQNLSNYTVLLNRRGATDGDSEQVEETPVE